MAGAPRPGLRGDDLQPPGGGPAVGGLRPRTAGAAATLEALRQIAAAHGKSVAQVAINWVLSHAEVDVAITGGDTVEQMEENLGAVGWSITPAERTRLDEVSRRG